VQPTGQGVLSLLATLGSKHILMAQKRKDFKKFKTFKKVIKGKKY